MRICIDLTSLADNFSGIERFALSITKELIKNKEHQWVLLFKNSIHKEFQNVDDNVDEIIIKGNNKLVFNQLLLPIKLMNIKADRFFFPAFPAPFFFFNDNAFNTIHDLSCWDCPGSNKKHMIWYFKIMYWKASLCNKKIITVSEFSKGRICKVLKVNPENVFVVYNGISERFNSDVLTEHAIKHIKEKYTLPDNYVLCLSTLEPRKNLSLLLDSYASLFNEGIVEEIVLAGRKGWIMDKFLKNYDSAFLSHVHFTGFVDEEDLPGIYKLSKLFVFPSLYEGFGIPPVEALACGVPVISSDATSMPEILGKNALFFKNNDKINLKKVITGIDFNSFKKQEAVLQAHKYCWVKEADKLKRVLEKSYS